MHNEHGLILLLDILPTNTLCSLLDIVNIVSNPYPTHQLTQIHNHNTAGSSRPCMIPGLSRRRLSLRPRILNRHPPMPKNPLLLHRNAIQPPRILRTRRIQQSQLFASGVHTLVHPHQLAFLCFDSLPLRQHPRPMNRPVSKRTHAGQLQRPRRLGMLHMVSNQLYTCILGGTFAFPARSSARGSSSCCEWRGRRGECSAWHYGAGRGGFEGLDGGAEGREEGS